MWPDNRIARDAHYLYRYDRYGRLTEKTDLIPEGGIRTDDERTHRYHYDSQHRLVHYTRTQYAEPLVESRYLYDPLGRRVAKRVWRRERDLTGWMSLSRKPQVTWYGWDGDRLTTIQNDRTRIQTIYQPGSFTPLIRVETATGEQAKTQRRSLADTLQQSGGEDGGSVVFPPVLVQMLDRLESEILADRVSEESRRWLASCGLTVEQMQNQMDPVYTPARKIHLYHCDHRGLPLALVSTEGATEWCAEYDEWGNLLNEENPHQLQQLIRLPGQQYDEESGLYYNPARKIHLYHCDHRGLPLALVSTEGATEWCAEYDEWGNLLNEENPHQLQQLIRLPGSSMDPVYTPARKIHLYHCDHRGLPLALVSTEGATEWCAEYDEWGNLLNEENPHQLQQLIRLLVQMLDRLESEILADRVSEESRRWLASCGLTVEQMQNQMDPVYTPARKIHLYHCDHRGLPLALVSTEGATEWCAEYDEWGNLLNEENPHQLQQLRLPGQRKAAAGWHRAA